MASFDIRREVEISPSFRTAAVMGQYDLSAEHVKERFQGAISLANLKWNVGVIWGASGTGKSTIARELWPEDYVRDFPYDGASIVDDMPEGAEVADICRVFNSVGFSSPPSWLKPYGVLSTGEQMRVDLARAILEDRELIVFDEFTSVVDRTVAEVGSAAIAKAVRRMDRKFIAVSCHSDILDWLEPDWEFNTDTMEFAKKNDGVLSSISRSAQFTAATGPPLGGITI